MWALNYKPWVTKYMLGYGHSWYCDYCTERKFRVKDSKIQTVQRRLIFTDMCLLLISLRDTSWYKEFRVKLIDWIIMSSQTFKMWQVNRKTNTRVYLGSLQWIFFNALILCCLLNSQQEIQNTSYLKTFPNTGH